MSSGVARLAKGPKKVSRRVRHEAGRLALLVDHLNRIQAMHGEQREIWEEVEKIAGYMLPAADMSNPSGTTKPTLLVSGELTPWSVRKVVRFTGLALRRFRALAGRAPVLLDVSGRKGRWPDVAPILEPVVKPRDLRGLAALLLWEAFPYVDRLRRCDQCARWFEDRSDSGNRRFCKRQCSTRWWTRGRRRLATSMAGKNANRRK